jgi:hypothetical protein
MRQQPPRYPRLAASAKRPVVQPAQAKSCGAKDAALSACYTRSASCKNRTRWAWEWWQHNKAEAGIALRYAIVYRPNKESSRPFGMKINNQTLSVTVSILIRPSQPL